MRVVTTVRTIRATYEVDRKRRLDATLIAADPGERAFFTKHEAMIRHLALLGGLNIVAGAGEAPGTIRQPVDSAELRIPMAGLFDVAAETARLSREVEKMDAELLSLGKKLDNPQFVDRAKPEVVREARERVDELKGRRVKIDATLEELRGLA
jgi:valyl-tRNA synthetase